ncbi:MAG: c-type cytochrome [Kofleriaceae bacterium]|nr:c-type cytochrome [Kofleriaceae bacterium]
MTRGWQLVVVATLAVGCGDSGEKPIADSGVDGSGSQTAAARGQYIMNVLAQCTFCHTPLREDGTRDLDKLLAGVDCFVDIDSADFTDNGNGTGCVSTRNLTNDATGLKNATDEQIKNAFRNGIRTDGKKLAPIMPYWVFHNMSDEDADAIVAYLRTVPGVSHTVKPNEPPWTQYNDGTAPMSPFAKPSDIPMPRGGENNQSAMRGRYLAGMAGLCIDCHTPETTPMSFVLDFEKSYAGGRVFPKGSLGLIDPSYPALIMTRNITPDATGLKDWTREQIKSSIAIGKDTEGKAVCAATHGGMISPYAALEPQDLDDIVEYIYNLPPIENDTTTCTDPGCGNCQGPPVQ